ncbi:MAG TPA: sugar kinase [Thermoplasmatales archaeon]|nr:sugar kinase [Thermoplasmatales archaeon]
MRWGLIVKPNDIRAESIAKEVVEFLKGKGEIYAEKSIADSLKMKSYSTKEINDLADIVITIGGDGTILYALEYIDKPIFAINCSAMGFLTEVDSKFAKSGLKKILEGEYNVEERAKLKVFLNNKRLPDAANEITIQTANIAKLIEFSILVEDELIEKIRADGIIVATPTGATGYALSVGGPIVDPLVEAVVIAPIAPFKLSARPWIIPYRKRICVELSEKSKDGKLVIDGKSTYSVSPNQRVCVTLSEKKARFIRFGETFYQSVRLKLVR